MVDVEAIERRARLLAGGAHVRGCIPHRHWREAIAETLGIPVESESQRVNRIMREVLANHLEGLKVEARKNGWL